MARRKSKSSSRDYTGGASTSTGGAKTSTATGGASTGGVGSGIGGAGTGGAATGGASTGGAGTVTINVGNGSRAKRGLTVNVSHVGGNTTARGTKSGDGPGAKGDGGRGSLPGRFGTGEPEHFGGVDEFGSYYNYLGDTAVTPNPIYVTVPTNQPFLTKYKTQILIGGGLIALYVLFRKKR